MRVRFLIDFSCSQAFHILHRRFLSVCDAFITVTMVEVPTIEETKNTLLDSGKAAAGASLGYSFGTSVAGPLGGAVAGTAGAQAVGSGNSADAASTIVLYDSMNQLLMGAQNQNNSGSNDPGAI